MNEHQHSNRDAPPSRAQPIIDCKIDHKRTDAFDHHTYALHVVELNRNHVQGMAEAMKSLDRTRILRVLEAVTMQRVEWQAAIHTLRLLQNDEKYFADVGGRCSPSRGLFSLSAAPTTTRFVTDGLLIC